MKVVRFGGYFFAWGIAFLIFGSNAPAQESSSSASVSRSRAIANTNPLTRGNSNYPETVFTAPDEIAVEEFVNYHRHRLPLPKAGQAVMMDTRWGNGEVSRTQRDAVLQIGFTTPDVNERTDLRPLNLAFVIDKSGSMAESDKMSRVKDSLRTLIDKLRPDDIVSIIVFDTEAEVLFPAGRIGNGVEIRRAIDCIEPAGSTNLHGGLMLGYREALKNFRKDATNRVILLTDGIANVGIVEPSKIAAESSEFNGQGLDLSTIGVGLNLNNDLLRTLAKSGRGLYHFISDYQDIDKVFVKEVQSLISQVAKKVDVSIDYDSNLQLEKTYGYAPKMRSNNVSLGLDDMNNGLTQVIMLRFRAPNGLKSAANVKVRLSYFDVKRQKRIEETQTVTLQASEQNSSEMLVDSEVKKNYTIAELADALFEMTAAAKRQNFRQAENFLNQATATAYKRFPTMEDKDLRFVLNIVESYQRDLKTLNGNRRNDDCGRCD